MLRAFPLIVLSLMTALAMPGAARAQKGGCKDVPTRWFFYPAATQADGTTVPAAVMGDGNWYDAAINMCGQMPTYDSTLLTGKRKLTLALPNPVTGSVIDESLAGSYQASSFVNVRNLLCVGCSKGTLEPFTTRIAFTLDQLANRNNYRLRFMPQVADAPDRHSSAETFPDDNNPFESSAVTVLPQPYNCTAGGSTRPSWIVRGTNPTSDPRVSASENLQVGTLYRASRSGPIHAGQYSLPFEIRIEALSCFSY